jgi:hypothetical protein
LFEGLSDTLRILVDAAGGRAKAQLAQLEEDIEAASDSRPTTLTAARLCLERLVTSAAGVVGSLDAGPESHATWWARALARQSQAALDELTFLAPWILLPASQHGPGAFGAIDEIPTLRELARLEQKLLPAIIDFRAQAAGNQYSSHGEREGAAGYPLAGVPLIDRLGDCATPEEDESLADIQQCIT